MALNSLRINAVFRVSADSTGKVLSKCNHQPTSSLQEEFLKDSKKSDLALAEFLQACSTAVQVALVDSTVLEDRSNCCHQSFEL